MAKRDSVDWRGYWSATVTPFTSDGTLDMSAWTQLIELLLDREVHGVVVNGTSGEWFSQSMEERIDLTEAAVDVVAGKVPVLAGVSSYTARESAALAQAAEVSGADGLIVTPPPYIHPTDDELFKFYRDVISSTGLPLMVYNWPRGTAVDISLSLFRRLAELDRVVAIKDSTGDTAKTLDTLEMLGNELRIFSRFINPLGLAVRTELGEDGFIDGGALGAVYGVSYYNAVWRGDLDTARAAAAEFNNFWGGMVREDYSGRYASPIAQIKAAMRLLNQPSGYVRPPLMDLEDPALLAALKKHLLESGIEHEI